MRASHSDGVVTMREAPFNKFSALAQEAFSFRVAEVVAGWRRRRLVVALTLAESVVVRIGVSGSVREM